MPELNPYYQQVVPGVRPGVNFDVGQKRRLPTNWSSGGGGGYGGKSIDTREAEDMFVRWNTQLWEDIDNKSEQYLGDVPTQAELDDQWEKEKQEWYTNAQKVGDIRVGAENLPNGTQMGSPPQRKIAEEGFNYKNYRAEAEAKVQQIIKDLKMNKREAEEFRLRSLANLTEIESQWNSAAENYQDTKKIRRYQELIDRYIDNGNYSEAIVTANEMREQGLIHLKAGEGELSLYNMEDTIYTAQDTETLKNFFNNAPVLEGKDLSERLDWIDENQDAIMETLGKTNGYRGIKDKDQMIKVARKIYGDQVDMWQEDQNQQRRNSTEIYEKYDSKIFEAIDNGDSKSLLSMRTEIQALAADDRNDSETLEPLLRHIDAGLAPEGGASDQQKISWRNSLMRIITDLYQKDPEVGVDTILGGITKFAQENAISASMYKEFVNQYANLPENAQGVMKDIYSMSSVFSDPDIKSQVLSMFISNRDRYINNPNAKAQMESDMALLQDKTFRNNLFEMKEAGMSISNRDLKLNPGKYYEYVKFNTGDVLEDRAIMSSLFPELTVNSAGILDAKIGERARRHLLGADYEDAFYFVDKNGIPSMGVPIGDEAQAGPGGLFRPVKVIKAYKDNNGDLYYEPAYEDDIVWAGLDENSHMQVGKIEKIDGFSGKWRFQSDYIGNTKFTAAGTTDDIINGYENVSDDAYQMAIANKIAAPHADDQSIRKILTNDGAIDVRDEDDPSLILERQRAKEAAEHEAENAFRRFRDISTMYSNREKFQNASENDREVISDLLKEAEKFKEKRMIQQRDVIRLEEQLEDTRTALKNTPSGYGGARLGLESTAQKIEAEIERQKELLESMKAEYNEKYVPVLGYYNRVIKEPGLSSGATR